MGALLPRSTGKGTDLARARTMTPVTQKPLLFVDVDGVISLFGFSPSVDEVPGAFHWIDGVAHCIAPATGERLMRLAERFDLVWATGWEELANEHLPALLGLPASRLPCLSFDGRAVFGSSHWKLDALTEHAGDRPAAWIDDNIDDACRLWALSREAPTLLVETRPASGMSDDHVDELLAWADTVAPPGSPESRAGTRAA